MTSVLDIDINLDDIQGTTITKFIITSEIGSQHNDIKIIRKDNNNISSITVGSDRILIDSNKTQFVGHTQGINHQDLIHSGVHPHTDIDTHLEDTFNPHMVTKDQLGLGHVENIKNNISNINPTVDDDINSGYSVGSKWWNTFQRKEFVCVDPTDGIWEETTIHDHSHLENIGTYTHPQIDHHINNKNLHREINDNTISKANLWSALKITQELDIITINSTDDVEEGVSNLYFTNKRVNQNPTVVSLLSHVNDTDNPHNVTLNQLSLTENKGDILVETGDSLTSLPCGEIGQMLTVNPNTESGLEWTDYFHHDENTTAKFFDDFITSNILSHWLCASCGLNSNIDSYDGQCGQIRLVSGDQEGNYAGLKLEKSFVNPIYYNRIKVRLRTMYLTNTGFECGLANKFGDKIIFKYGTGQWSIYIGNCYHTFDNPVLQGDTDWHIFKIITGQTVKFYVDNVQVWEQSDGIPDHLMYFYMKQISMSNETRDSYVDFVGMISSRR